MSVRKVSAEEFLGAKFIVAPASAYPGLVKWHQQKKAKAEADKAKPDGGEASDKT